MSKASFTEKILFFLIIFCLVYYLSVGLSIGFHISLLWLWLFAAGFLALWWAFLFLTRRGVLPRLPRKVYTAAKLVLALIVGAFLLAEGCIVWGMCQKADRDCEAVIILGAAVHGETPSLALSTRLRTAEEYLRGNPDCLAVCSGGQGPGERITEAEAMRRYLLGRNIAASRLLTEEGSTSTAENFRYSLELIGDRAKRVCIVTGNYHVFRALLLANKAGGGEYEFSAQAAPYPHPLLLHYMLREAAVTVMDILRGNIL